MCCLHGRDWFYHMCGCNLHTSVAQPPIRPGSTFLWDTLDVLRILTIVRIRPRGENKRTCVHIAKVCLCQWRAGCTLSAHPADRYMPCIGVGIHGAEGVRIEAAPRPTVRLGASSGEIERAHEKVCRCCWFVVYVLPLECVHGTQ